MPLQNRVDPFGALIAAPGRGMFMGNRGGRIHRDDRTLGQQRWTSRRWICCVLAFKQRRREVWGNGYTELFFLDEPTALAAGHRPCFECRRGDAQEFARCLARGLGLAQPLSADAMDAMLHAERLQGRDKRQHRLPLDALPDGSFVLRDGQAFAVRGRELLRWSNDGYDERRARPRGVEVDTLTPPAMVAALAGGYRLRWHASAEI